MATPVLTKKNLTIPRKPDGTILGDGIDILTKKAARVEAKLEQAILEHRQLCIIVPNSRMPSGPEGGLG